MRTLAAPAGSERIVRGSRFIGCVQPARDRADAMAVVAGLRAQHPQATHVCWALLAGGHSAAVDDGEPGGTAGRPMLDVLRYHDLDGVLATAVRYFGGVKLGAGGLVRAYTDCIAQALREAVTVEVRRWTQAACLVPYAAEGAVRRVLAAHAAPLLDARHGPAVWLSFSAPDADLDTIRRRIDDATHGAATWPPGGGPG